MSLFESSLDILFGWDTFLCYLIIMCNAFCDIYFTFFI